MSLSNNSLSAKTFSKTDEDSEESLRRTLGYAKLFCIISQVE